MTQLKKPRINRSDLSYRQRIIADSIGKINGGVSISLRTVLYAIKKRMREEPDPEKKMIYASVGLEINGLLMRL